MIMIAKKNASEVPYFYNGAQKRNEVRQMSTHAQMNQVLVPIFLLPSHS